MATESMTATSPQPMRKVAALVGVGIRRTVGRLRGGDARRVVITAVGVCLAVALMTTVTGVALGLASGSTVRSDDVNYWVVPEGGSASTIAVSVDGPQLGAVHSLTARLQADERVDYVTPVQMRIVRIRAGEATDYVLAVGVIPDSENRTIAGVTTGGMTAGDPHYANGSFDGPWTGEAIVSDAAASLLEVNHGDRLDVAMGSANQSFTATRIQAGDLNSGVGPVPVMLVHLSELQSISGATGGDQADQLLVSTDSPAVKETLEGLYPRTQVIAKGGIGAGPVSTSSLPLAVAVAALLAALVIGTLFTATLMGLEMTADRTQLAVLEAIGYSTRSRAVLVTVETLSVTAVGGLAGVVLGAGGIVLVNAVSADLVGVATVARFHPLLLGYGLGVALLIGALAAPYPVWQSSRTDVLEVLGR